jgi:type I restriction enzyme R subunit
MMGWSLLSNFAFLLPEWPALHTEAIKAERLAVADPRTSCFYARRALELAINWLYEVDDALRLPYHTDLASKIAEATMASLVGPRIRTKMDIIRREGNAAVHRNTTITGNDSMRVVVELFHVMYWVARHYVRDPAHQPAVDLTFDDSQVPRPVPAEVRRAKQAELQAQAEQFARAQEEFVETLRRNRDLTAEITQLREEIKAAKAANAALPDTHDYDEAQTRELIIDLLLKEAGWALDRPEDQEYPVTGLPTPSGKGKVDYVLWGDNGKPLAVVEAKRTMKSAQIGQEQARYYANALEAETGQRPVIFYTNGYETWLWDDQRGYPPRKVQGFYTKDELELLVQRRASRQALKGVGVNDEIVGRNYQVRAIRHIGESFDEQNRRRALLVMATGTGKTRVSIALVDQLLRANWVKRVLFLADRQALVTQAVNEFKTHLPGAPVVNLLTERETEARVYVSTHQTMLGMINDTQDGKRRFGPGYFDLVIIDEAHRSIYQKYGTIFDYFDSLLVGLTATPKDEVDRNTYRLFNLPPGEPTDAYGLEEAIEDGWLVRPEGVDVPLKFMRRGIKYADLTEEEREEWDAADWGDEDGAVPDEVSADDINKFLFNADTVDKSLETLMTRGIKVESGDRLGKTIIFARNNKHAEFIVERFNKIYPEHGGEFARVITYQTSYADRLIDAFKIPDKPPFITVSVDMLDTGIDVPEVVNLMFAKTLHSKTKFWQMIGRGTRLCPELLGPNQDKDSFLVFDLCANLEYFNLDLPDAGGRIQPSLSERIFTGRTELLYELDRLQPELEAPGDDEDGTKDDEDGTKTASGLRRDVAARLRDEVDGMDPNNIEVRSHLRAVDTYRDPGAWEGITAEKRAVITGELAGLPTAYQEDEHSEEAKRFDYLMLRLQLSHLTGSSDYLTLRRDIQAIASALLDETVLSIPAVRERRQLLDDVASDEWWQDVTLPMLETVRRRLRGIVKLVPKIHRGVVYADYGDTAGPITSSVIKGMPAGAGLNRFVSKVRSYLRTHEHDPVVRKLYGNQLVTKDELSSLTALFVESGFGTEGDVEAATTEYDGLGLLLRKLGKLDYDAAAAVFSFLTEQSLNQRQRDYVGLLIGTLSENGVLRIGDLYEPPFSLRAPTGPDELFANDVIDQIAEALETVRANAQPEA